MRFLIPLFLILFLLFLARSVLRGLVATAQKMKPGGRPDRSGGVKLGKMEKDPVCGTYVDVATSVHGVFGGQVKHFCSQDCLNKYKQRW